MSTFADDDRRVIAGVDTHKDFHVVVVLDERGRKLDTATFSTTTSGYRDLTGGRPASVKSSWSASKAPRRGGGERVCASNASSHRELYNEIQAISRTNTTRPPLKIAA